MITPYSIIEENKELRLIGYMEVHPPFDTDLFLGYDFENGLLPAINMTMIEGKTKILTRQSPNRDFISSDINSEIYRMLTEASISTFRELSKMEIENPVTLLFTYRRQLWDWEIICQAYV